MTPAATSPLFPSLLDPPAGEALSIAGRTISYPELEDAVATLALRLAGASRVAVWAEPSLEAAVGVLGALAAGAAAVPINPQIGERELEHVVRDSAPACLLAPPGTPLPPVLAALPRQAVDPPTRGAKLPPEPGAETPALILYTSGTTGPPKGAVLSRRAVAANLDALAEAWEWTERDVLVHALPLFHVHGLVLGILGPLRLGARAVHAGRFSPAAVCGALSGGGTMLFGVPTMYHRLADAAERDPAAAAALARARLLVSGSAALPVREHERLRRATGQPVLERYGLTETLIDCAIRAAGEPRPGYVGPPLTGVELRLVDDGGEPFETADDETIGEVQVRGSSLFSGYLNRPDATREAFRDGWFATGDLATRAGNGYVRIVGRRATDLIKTGGFKVGAGEVEAALLEHAGVAEAAVTGEADDDLGERIVAWVVPRDGTRPSARELADHVAALLAAHKRPREVRFLDALPRNELGKVRKTSLKTPPERIL